MKNKLNKTIGLTSVVVAGATVLPLATAQDKLAQKQAEKDKAETTVADKEKEIQNLKQSVPNSNTIDTQIADTKKNITNKESQLAEINQDKTAIDQKVADKKKEIADYKPKTQETLIVEKPIGDDELKMRPEPMEVVDFQGRKIEPKIQP